MMNKEYWNQPLSRKNWLVLAIASILLTFGTVFYQLSGFRIKDLF